jgi:hypothetical protein
MRRALLLLPLLAAACDLTREPTPLALEREFIAVHSVLLAGDERASVLVSRARPSDDPAVPHHAEPVAGATVRLSVSGSTVTLEPSLAEPDRCAPPMYPHSGFGPGCYSAEIPAGIAAGQTYSLEVVLPGGGIVTGATTIPAAPVVRTDVADPTLVTAWFGTGSDEQAPVSLSWQPAPETLLEVVSVRLHDDTCQVWIRPDDGDGAVEYIVLNGRSRVDVRAERVFCAQGTSEGTYAGELRVLRYDGRYTQYAAAAGDASVPIDALAFGLTGAAGVFAAATVASAPVTVVQR